MHRKCRAQLNSLMVQNLFYSHHNINTIFLTVNVELEKKNQTADKLIKLTKLTVLLKIKKLISILYFIKYSSRDGIPLTLPDLKIENQSIE